MDYLELVKSIPKPMRKPLSEKFMDILLEANVTDAVPSSVAKTILYYWQRDQLDSEAGLTLLFRTVFEADLEKAIGVIDDFGLDLVTTVPEDPNLTELDIKGEPIIELPENSPLRQAAKEIISKLAL